WGRCVRGERAESTASLDTLEPSMRHTASRRLVVAVALLALAAAAGGTLLSGLYRADAQIGSAPPGPPPATPASVATVESRDVTLWTEFSARLEAIGRVDIRPRVSG